ncbi:hypothetical protein [Streptomyces sp. TP-A0356]|uniref:hypothetical protein n=1 Tax=Streptomyces sp. TP-A0356 TaxID=1359208 RepID=UPI0006E289A7|nr:hypothetical protein [Streptomyces sp. TP-A0356]
MRDVGPYEMTSLWAWGMGTWYPTIRFDESDLLTRELEKDPHNQDILDNCRMSDTYCTTAGVTRHEDYSDAGLQNLPLDALAGISHGLFGRPPVDGFLGSYTETVTVRSYNPRTSTAVVDFYVDNKSGFESFEHAWTQHGHNTSSGPGATIEEKFFWTKTVQVGEVPPGMVELAN